MTTPLLSQVRGELAKLEAMKRRRGIVTVSVLRDALPQWLRSQCSPAVLADIAAAINAQLADADPLSGPTIDHQSRASNDA